MLNVHRKYLFLFNKFFIHSISQTRVTAYKELDMDLIKQNGLASLEDLDLSVLTKCLIPDDQLNEPDEVWNWEQVFAEISSALHVDNNPST